jgi:hypothetical protein
MAFQNTAGTRERERLISHDISGVDLKRFLQLFDCPYSDEIVTITLFPALTMKTKDWFSRSDLFGLQRQWTDLPLFNLFFTTTCRNRRIKSRGKAKVVATDLAVLNVMAGARTQSRISRLRRYDLTPMSGITFLSRKTRCALRTCAPIGFARLFGAMLALSAPGTSQGQERSA